jgi:hypothetical protein
VFDFRYHVASLAAVFVALVIGILVGVGLSGKGFIDDAERRNLNDRIAGLEQQVEAAESQLDAIGRGQQALADYAAATYPVLVPGRLDGRRVAVLFVGSVDQSVSFAVRQAVRDAGGTIARVRALRVPVDPDAVRDALGRRPSLAGLAAPGQMDEVGERLGSELVTGARTPVWDALAGTIVEEQAGLSTTAADAAVVARPADPQQGATREMLAALYASLARSGVPAVGVDPEGRIPSAVPAFRAARLSTVDSVNTAAGRLALVLLLAGAEPGSYGVDETARDGIVPPVAPAATTR